MGHTLDYKAAPKYSAYKKRHGAGNYCSVVILEQKFAELSGANCHYCGVPGPNGIDRVDCKKGYEVANCVTSCKHCN